MQAAFTALGGVTEQVAKQLANRGAYQLNNDETADLINWNNDLFYYQLGSDKAVRVTSNPEEEVGETFSPNNRMLGFVQNNNIPQPAASSFSFHKAGPEPARPSRPWTGWPL